MRIPRVRELYVDEAEGFLLEHALFSPPRTWPPLPPEQTQSVRLQSKAKKMDWEGEVRRVQPGEDDSMDLVHAGGGDSGSEGESNKERCVICLMGLRDRSIVGVCGHEFCFECIGVWANQSRRCPLCSADMAPFLLHDLDNTVPTKFYLPPLPSRPVISMDLPGPSRRVQRPDPEFEPAEPDELDLQIERRKEIYQNGLYCKHMGSNAQTRYRPNPTPHEIANSPQLIQRATAFLRRELRVWSHADVEYLTSHILSLIKAVDVRSDVAVRLLAEFLDPPVASASTAPLGTPNGAEHFAHELYCWLRSPYKELRQWDLVAQYDDLDAGTKSVVGPEPVEVSRQSRSPSPERKSRKRSVSRSVSRSPSLSRSLSPSSRSRSSYSCSSRSQSSYSRSPSPRRPDRHQFIPSKRAWDQGDFWIDPEIEEERAAQRRKMEQQREEKRAAYEAREIARDRNGMRLWGAPPAGSPKERVELLPEHDEAPKQPLRAEIEAAAIQISIKGAGATRRLTLAERLTKAKAEQSGIIEPVFDPPKPTQPILPSSLPDNAAEINAEDLLQPTSPTSPVTTLDASRRSVSGLKETVRARLRLRLKLESERADLRHNVAESKAQELRRRLLEAKVTRQAAETDAVLRKMDRLDRQKEVRRRLMVEKMLQAETEGEKRARELKERLSADKRRKMLREVLLARKIGQEEGAQAIEVGA